MKFETELFDGSLEGGDLPGKLTEIFGRIQYDKDLIIWKNVSLKFKDKTYESSGELNNFDRPIVETSLVSDEMDLITTFKILNNAFTVTSLSGTYLDTILDVRGEIHLEEKGNPFLDLKGRFNTDLVNLPNFGPKIEKLVKPYNPSGMLIVEFLYRGKAKDWKDALIVATGDSHDLSVKNIKLNNAVIKLEQGDRDYTHLDINGDFYGGKLGVATLSDWKKGGTPFTLSARLENVNLDRLKKDTKWKRKKYAGNMNAQVNLSGKLKDKKNIVGQGYAEITEGALWELNLFQGVLRFLTIDEFENIIITDASANFAIKDEKIWTDDLSLKARQVEFFGRGWVDFNQENQF